MNNTILGALCFIEHKHTQVSSETLDQSPIPLGEKVDTLKMAASYSGIYAYTLHVSTHAQTVTVTQSDNNDVASVYLSWQRTT